MSAKAYTANVAVSHYRKEKIMYGSELSNRKKQILKAIVESHIELGEPIGSKSLMQLPGISCSSATIRNEMAELEELGYLEQPHTSAGRVPSQLGYRFYVDQLLEHYAMTKNEIAQIDRVLKSKTAELDQILLTASKLASAMTNYTGLAVKPGRSSAVVTRFETAYIDEYNFVLIMINTTGNVISKHIRMTAPKTQETVAKLSTALNANVVGLPADALNMSVILRLEEEMGADAEIVSPIIKTVYTALTENDGGDLQLTGIGNLLHYRDYENPEQLGDLLGTLEQKDEILRLVSDSPSEDISVLIGSESSVKVMNNSAIVFKPIVRDGKTLGVIGVLGPLRMDYAKVLETIEQLCGSITGIMDEHSALAPPGKKTETNKPDIKEENNDN